jgi:hypothetical protein
VIFVLFFIKITGEVVVRSYALAAVIVVLFFATPAWADFYRYVDRDGREFFTNDLKQVPKEYRGSATMVKPDIGRVNVADGSAVSEQNRAKVKEHRDKYGRGEEHWRKKAAKLRAKLRDQQDEYDLVLKQLDDLGGSSLETDKRKKKSRTSLLKKKRKFEKNIAQTRRKLEIDLPEEARKADAYPGWVRE